MTNRARVEGEHDEPGHRDLPREQLNVQICVRDEPYAVKPCDDERYSHVERDGRLALLRGGLIRQDAGILRGPLVRFPGFHLIGHSDCQSLLRVPLCIGGSEAGRVELWSRAS